MERGKKKGRAKTTDHITVIASSSRLRGELRFEGQLEVEGQVEGSIQSEEDGHSLIVVREGGKVQGDIQAPLVIVNGEVHGDIRCSQHLELAANAMVHGDIQYSRLEMAAGARIDGRLVFNLQEEKEEPASKGISGWLRRGGKESEKKPAKGGKQGKSKGGRGAQASAGGRRGGGKSGRSMARPLPSLDQMGEGNAKAPGQSNTQGRPLEPKIGTLKEPPPMSRDSGAASSASTGTGSPPGSRVGNPGTAADGKPTHSGGGVGVGQGSSAPGTGTAPASGGVAAGGSATHNKQA